MDSTNFEDFNSPAGGVELSDTLSSWRKKTNGIVVEVDSVKSTAATLATTVSTLATTVATSAVNNNSLALGKITTISNLKVLGNTSGSPASVSEISVLDQDTLSSNSPTALATQQSIKAYVDNQFFDGQIVQQKTYRFDAVHDTDVVNRLNIQSSGTYNSMWLAAGVSGAPDILSAENFSRDGATAANHGMAEVPVRTTITPRYASSLLCIEWHLTGEPNNYNSGFVIGRHRSDGKVEVINDTGYEGYNSSIQTQRNNYYSSMFYDRDEASTMKTTVVRYFIPAVNTNERTYTIIFADPNNNHSYVLNRTHTFSNGHEYEHGVSTATVQELYQV